MKARKLKLDSPMSELQAGGDLPSNDLKKSLSQSNMGDYFSDTKTIVRWFRAFSPPFLYKSGHIYLEMVIDVSRNLLEKVDLNDE